MFRTAINTPNNNNKNLSDIFISDINFNSFQRSLTEEKIKKLYLQLKQYEKKGYVIYPRYLISMKKIFDPELPITDKNQEIINSQNSSASSESDSSEKSRQSCYDELYDLIFKRFREIKCIIKNNKNIFYLTDFKKENYINSYNLVCALSIFLISCFENKIKLLFNLSDVDEDGYLNKKEIELMIVTINQLFGEEVSTINTNSSILSQSLTNIKVNNILYELLYGEGNLYNKLVEEKNYITFDKFYECIKNIKNYKYKIMPCYVNFKDCLFSHRKEKMINVREKYKKDFIDISSALVLEMNKNINFENYKKFSLNNLSEIIVPIKINKNEYLHKENKFKKLKINASPEKFRRNIKNRESFIKSDRSLKELMKNSTIFDENGENNKNKANSVINEEKLSRKNISFQYAFQANFSDIKNIEVEPGIIKFLPNEVEKNHTNKNNIKLTTKSPNKRKRLNNISINTNKNKDIKFLQSINKVNENENDEEEKDTNLNQNKNSNNNINFKNIKSFDSFPSKNVNNLPIGTFLLRHSNSTYIKKRKNFVIKNKNLNERYKTLDEILKEIKTQEKNFNLDSAGVANNKIIIKFKKIQLDMKMIKKAFKFIYENKRNSSNFQGLLGENKDNIYNFRTFRAKSL